MSLQHTRWCLGIATLSLLVAGRATAQVNSVSTLMAQHGIQLDTTELAAIERGERWVRVLPTELSRDVSLIGVVRVALSRDVYVRRLQDFRTSLRLPSRPHFGVFSEPVQPADVAAVSATAQDAKDLRDCRPLRCDLKLPAVDMQRLQREADWSSPDVAARLSELARARMLRYVSEYREHGNDSLVVYDDRATVRASDVVSALLAQSAYLTRDASTVANYLRTFPRGRPGGVADVMYWSEDVAPRLRSTLSITHTMLITPPELPGTTLLVSKQIYANHYYEGRLDLQRIVDGGSGEGANRFTYVIIERRIRFDNLPRGGLMNIRGRAINGLRDQLASELGRAQLPIDARTAR
jgi:hypothetical protein